MDIKNKLRRVKSVLKSQTRASRISKAACKLLPEVACIDVGASYYPHPAWNLFRQSPRTDWIAVEPNHQNLGYTRPWRYAAQLKTVTTGLSEFGGKQVLYVTNIDSGSSLLPPVIPEGEKYRYMHDYFFPVRETTIDTLTLDEVVSSHAAGKFIAVKLDTQGTELSILKGLNAKTLAEKLVCVEVEVSLRANPPMLGSAKFFEVLQFLENLGMELVQIKPIEGSLPAYGKQLKNGRSIPNECDSMFLLRAEEARKRGKECLQILVGFYLAYNLFGEAKEALKSLDTGEARQLLKLIS